MGLILKCLFTLCCDGDDEQAESYEPTLSSSPNARMQVAGSPPSAHAMSRPGMMSRGGGGVSGSSALLDAQQSYQIAPQGSHEDDDEDTTNNNSRASNADGGGGPAGIFRSHPCCGSPGDEETRHGSSSPSSGATAGLPDFFRRIRDRWRMYDSLETTERLHLAAAGASASPSSSGHADLKKGLASLLPPPSPLRQASSFDSSRDIPVISKDEVVLPGSDLQKEMAVWQSKTLERLGDECVICMEGFDPSNPRMPTMCGCGENKTFFHLPCLYQWVEQCEECPSCRQRLVWEEF